MSYVMNNGDTPAQNSSLEKLLELSNVHGESAVTFLPQTGFSSLLKICTTQSLVKQKIILMQVCTILEYGMSGFNL